MINSQAAPWVVAMTGGIASGKSAAARRFQSHGVPVHDADVAARAVVAPGSPGLAAIVARFGPAVLAANGELDRAAMRARIFQHPAERQVLEAILHPQIRQWLRERIAEQHEPYAMLAIPLLAEHRGDYAWLDRIVLIELAPDLQQQRLIQRDGISAELAQQMISSQASASARRAIADDIIDNAGSEDDLQLQVDQLHQRYLQAARHKQSGSN